MLFSNTTICMSHKPIALERKAIPGRFSGFFLRFFGEDWKRYKKYETVERAQQAHEQLCKSSFHRDFEYRLNTPVGLVMLPVVKS